jgi:segregation and condensation protein B
VSSMADPPPTDPTDWQIDGEEFLLNPVFEPEQSESPKMVVAVQAPAVAMAPPPQSDEPPPRIDQIIEAMLFIGGPPLTSENASAAVRGLSAEQFHESIRTLQQRYLKQNRPYAIHPQGNGFQLVVKPAFRTIRDRLFGGPREARLSQPALDILSLVAYRQPVTKAEIDAIRGADSGGTLRQLVRLGLVVISRRTADGERVVTYGTTARFLTLFHLTSLDDLPRLGESQRLP